MNVGDWPIHRSSLRPCRVVDRQERWGGVSLLVVAPASGRTFRAAVEELSAVEDDPTGRVHRLAYAVSWEATIISQRTEIGDLLTDNPSLRSELSGLVARRWHVAVKQAAAETGRAADVFPATCPWSIEQVLDSTFFPS